MTIPEYKKGGSSPSNSLWSTSIAYMPTPGTVSGCQSHASAAVQVRRPALGAVQHKG